MGKQRWADGDDEHGDEFAGRTKKKHRGERAPSLRMMEGAEGPPLAFMRPLYGPGPGAAMRRDDAPRVHHAAVCASCNAATTVPFKPFPGRAVLCRDCFRKSA